MRYASAEVRKQFFIEMFTRDISLEDCVLDLIDNSLDSYLLKYNVAISELIFGSNGGNSGHPLGMINVMCTDREIKVVDTCGGIPRKRAMDEIFCFGHDEADEMGRLGAYGVGMKRALFKIGNKFDIVSRTAVEGFEVSFKLDDWAEKKGWKVPITFVDGAPSDKKAGTSIKITELHPPVALRIKQGGVPSNILEDAALTYPFFLDRCVHLAINATHVMPQTGTTRRVRRDRETRARDVPTRRRKGNPRGKRSARKAKRGPGRLERLV
jgi:Histidine kinase-, DNA gyrase B-, and HSP90-like ATPase